MTNVRELVDVSREYGFVPRVHPNGFLQLDLDSAKTLRLHIWDKHLPRQKIATPIHDHEFALKSLVYLGCIINKRFRVTENFDGDGEYKKWTVRRDPNTEETTLVESEVEFNARQVTKELVHAGDSYVMQATEFHESSHVGRSLSIMQKLGYQAGHSASVLVPVGQGPDNEFRRESFAVDELWDTVYDTVDMI